MSLELPGSKIETKSVGSAEVVESCRSEDAIVKGLKCLFPDPVVAGLIDEAIDNNRDVALTSQRLREAGFELGIVKAGRLPSLSAGSQNGQRSLSAADISQYGLDATWELDVWGKRREQIRAGKKDLQAWEANYQDVMDSVAAQVVQAWFDVLAARQMVSLAADRKQCSKDAASLFYERNRAGTGDAASWHIASSDASAAEAEWQQLNRELESRTRILNCLLGRSVREPVPSGKLPVHVPGIPANLDSKKVAQRPDVRAAMAKLAAAEHLSEAAWLNRFPSFSLTGGTGLVSASLSSLIDSPSALAHLLVESTAPVFDAGLRKNQWRSAEARAEQERIIYLETVHQALKETDETISNHHIYRKELQALNEAARQAGRAMEMSREQSREGTVSNLQFLEAKERFFIIKQKCIAVKAAALNNRVAVTLAVGAGV